MNAISDANTTVLLMTTSMSYSRYFTTAFAMAAYMKRSARVNSTEARPQWEMKFGTNAIATSAAAVTNHLSWRRSSPTEPRKRTKSETTDASMATRIATSPPMNRASATFRRVPLVAVGSGPAKGSAQPLVAKMMDPDTSRPSDAAVIQPTGRHLRDRRCPDGNSRNRKGRIAIGIGQIQLEIHARARPAGSDPGVTIRAWIA